jgi:PelA/Pel-15E family pectate lyase
MKLKLIIIASFFLLTSSVSPQQPDRDGVLAAMKKATAFMTEKVSIHGGYLWNVSEDFSKKYGEVPARNSQIWVQAGTPMVGMAYLDAFDVTKDKVYLDAARKAADALIYGQNSQGGWHYAIDFEPKGMQDWYKNQASKFKWGMEEQRFYNGNGTFDDSNSSSATRFLLRFYLTSKEEKYHAPLLKALNFMLLAQYPNGAFPQRFPLHYDFIHDGFPDYTSYYTLNDGVMNSNIEVLLEAYQYLGDKRYLESARRGVDFMIAVQGPEDQAGWAEQYHPDTMQPVKARTHEPAGFVIRESADVIELLEIMYKMTGDRRYLRPIPQCLQWFERVNREALEFKRPTARYYELGTNLPVYVIRTDKVNPDGYGLYLWSNTISEGNMKGLSSIPGGVRQVVNVEPIRREYERVSKLSVDDAKAEYMRRFKTWETPPRADSAAVSKILGAMDNRGAWITDCRVLKLDGGPNGMNSGDFEIIKGYSSNVFVRNLRILASYARSGKN